MRLGAIEQDLLVVGVVIKQGIEKGDGFPVLPPHRHVNGGFLEFEIVGVGPFDGVSDMFQCRFEVALFGVGCGDH